MSQMSLYRSVCCIVIACAVTFRVDAGPGDLDPAFGMGGRVFFEPMPLGDASFVPTDVLVQADGYIMALGGTPALSTEARREFVVIRLTPSGILDPSFNRLGYKLLGIEGGRIGVGRMAQQTDGKLIITGTQEVTSTDSDIVVLRLHPGGSLDTTFGTDGIVRISFGVGSYDAGARIALQPDGGIVLGGITNALGEQDYAIARLTSTGALDATFGNQGRVMVSSGVGSTDSMGAMILQSDGRIVAGGHTLTNLSNQVPFLVRFTANGQLDVSFDGDGRSLLPVQPAYTGATVSQMVQQSDGRLVLTGTLYSNVVTGVTNSGLMRVTVDGALDGSIVLINVGAATSQPADMVLEPGGGFVVAGYRAGLIGYLARFSSFGVVDSTFGEQGVALIDSGRGELMRDFSAWRMARQPDGKFVVVGHSLQPQNPVASLGFTGYQQNRRLVMVRVLADARPATGVISLLSLTQTTLSEGTTYPITVTRTGGRSGIVSVDYSLVPVSATPNVDYTSLSGTLLWGDGDTSNRTITVDALNDGLYEASDEEFRLVLSNQAGGIAGATSTRLFIRNVNAAAQPTISLNRATQVDYEDSGLIVIAVPWTYSQSGGAGSVDYTLVPGSATANVDYVATSGTISLGGAATGSVAIALLADSIDELAETFTVRLSNPVNVTIGQAETVVTIIDNDVPSFVDLRDSTRSVNESETTVTFVVTRTAHSEGQVTVDYFTQPGTASSTPGTADFIATSGTLIWAAGDASPRTITVTLTPDTVIEPNETFTLAFSLPTGGALLGNSIVTATIVDNDTPTPPPPTPVNPGRSDEGGGGALDWLFGLLLLGLARARVHRQKVRAG